MRPSRESDMKIVMAIIKPFKLDEVRDALTGLAAGLTIYAPAIILSTVLGWRVEPTIIGTGLLVIVYTVTGGSATGSTWNTNSPAKKVLQGSWTKADNKYQVKLSGDKGERSGEASVEGSKLVVIFNKDPVVFEKD